MFFPNIFYIIIVASLHVDDDAEYISLGLLQMPSDRILNRNNNFCHGIETLQQQH